MGAGSAMTETLFESAVVEEPYPYFDSLRKEEPVHRIEGTDTFLVTQLALIHQVVADTETFSSNSNAFLHVSPDGSPGLRSSMGADPKVEMGGPPVVSVVDPPDHGRLRKVLNRVLTRAVIDRREAEYRELLDRALDEPLASGRVEWMGAVAEPVPSVMLARILGLDDDLAPFLKEAGFASVEQIGGFASADRSRELRDVMGRLGPVAEAYERTRQGQSPPSDTVLEACAQAVEAGEITDAEAIGTLIAVVTAGTESTSSLLGVGACVLAQRPDLQDALRRDPSAIPAFVEEACRIDPPFRGHYRRAIRTASLAGVEVPAGSHVVLVWPAANRDPRWFDAPGEFRLDRDAPRKHLGFGWGIHLCVGAPLARLQARVTFDRLLERTTSISIDPSASPLRHHRSLMIRRLVELPLVLRT